MKVHETKVRSILMMERIENSKNNESDNFHFYGTTVTEELYNLQEEGFKQEGGYAFVVTE